MKDSAQGKRESGYYWVRQHIQSSWTIAQYISSLEKWAYFYSAAMHSESPFEINENRIDANPETRIERALKANICDCEIPKPKDAYDDPDNCRYCNCIIERTQPQAGEDFTAEEFFRKKFRERYRDSKELTLWQLNIDGETAMRWAHEFKMQSHPTPPQVTEGEIPKIFDDDEKPFDKIENANFFAGIYYPDKVIVVTKDGEKLCGTDRSNAWEPGGEYTYFFYEETPAPVKEAVTEGVREAAEQLNQKL